MSQASPLPSSNDYGRSVLGIYVVALNKAPKMPYRPLPHRQVTSGVKRGAQPTAEKVVLDRGNALSRLLLGHNPEQALS